MIKSFRHKGLRELWTTGSSRRVAAERSERIAIILDALNAAKLPQQMNQPGFDFHALRGHRPPRYTVHINGPWCITFAWDGSDAVQVDLEQYH